MHKGHELLFMFASTMCHSVTVTLDQGQPSYVRQSIEQWFHHNQPNTRVEVITIVPINNYDSAHQVIPWNVSPNGTIIDSDFWDIYTKRLENVLETKGILRFDAVFSSDMYGAQIADILGATWIPVDPDRVITNNLSSTMIRDNIGQHFNLISEFQRPYYSKRVAIIGPESVGKSTLVEKLKDRYKYAACIPEWGRTIYEMSGGNLNRDQFAAILYGQDALVEQMAKTHHLTISDTESLVTSNFYSYWFPDSAAHRLFHDEAIQLAKKYDLYLVLAPNVPFINDGTRNCDEEWREETFKKLLWQAKSCVQTVVVDADNYNERFEQAIEAIDRIL